MILLKIFILKALNKVFFFKLNYLFLLLLIVLYLTNALVTYSVIRLNKVNRHIFFFNIFFKKLY